MLHVAENHQLKLNVIETALSLEFPPEEIKRQIDTLIDWGRYGELLAYEDSSEIISLEREKGKVE
jgi:NitT/TauT family transport system ATP-binding protein